MSYRDNEYKNYIDQHIEKVEDVWISLYKKLPLHQHEINLIDTLIIEHDQSKYGEEEFEGYRQKFYPEDDEISSETVFNISWLHHRNNNPHHWDYWLLYENNEVIALPMYKEYTIEMLCDWTAMSLNFKKNSPLEWYNSKKVDIILHKTTQEMIDYYIPYFEELYWNRIEKEKK